MQSKNTLQSDPRQNLPRRHRRIGKFIALGIAAAILSAVAVTAYIYRETIILLIDPSRIEISAWADTEGAVRALEDRDVIRNVLVLTEGGDTTLSFATRDASITVIARYTDGAFRSLQGTVNAMQTGIGTISGAQKYATEMLSPFFSVPETQAILIKFTPDIVAQAGRDSMDMSVTLGERYAASIMGQTMQTLDFTVTANY
ncbi:MAG: hypothetical protein LBR85_04940 [Oscillospiraceae bacterium]|jgi:hypothetical protein|nr:hypothetical protein [Oscillospiraceae bacterium]